MPRTMNVPRRSEGSAALAHGPAPATVPHLDDVAFEGVGASGVTLIK
jgi:hypothetical protein